MERLYFATFIPGAQEFVKDFLKNKLENMEVIESLDGAMLFKTSAKLKEIRSVRMFNNSFMVLERFKDKSLYDLANFALNEKRVNPEIKDALEYIEAGRTFRLIFSDENHLISMDKRLVGSLESKLTRFRLKIDRSEPDFEFWFLKRREGLGLFMIRLTKHRAFEKTLQKGELKPGVSNMMVFLSDPQGKEIVLDPFFGHGATILERSRYPFGRIIAIDNEPKKVFELRQKLKGKNVRIEKSDSLDMERLPEKSVDKIITDPPWGLFKKVDLVNFYEKMIKQFSRIIRTGGLVVLLTAQKDLVERILSKDKSFKIEKKYDVLVSGQKAAVYKIRKC
jgi:tRNA (guanine6-N2)-methyltransferase